jgi:hypothetical protein
MKHSTTLFFIVLAVAAFAIVARLALFATAGPVPRGEVTPAPEGMGWIDLLDETHAGGWTNITDDRDIFSVEDGVLHIFGHSMGTLRNVGFTAQSFSDFELHLEFKVTWRANSGVFLRASPDDPVYRGFEIQVLDDHGVAPHKNGSGSIYDVVAPMFNMALPRGEWNSYDITCQGTHVVVVMNGWKIIDTDFALMTQPLGKFSLPFAQLPREGIIALQDHGGEVWYRNIRVRPL